MKRIKLILPFLFLFFLLALFWRELFYAKPEELPSALVGEAVPTFKLPLLYQPESIFTEKNLIGQLSLLNVWASWCYPCSLEQPMLMKIKREYDIPIYSINYKDKEEDAKAWLHQYGNPYVMIGADKLGDTAIDFGVYGTPETFIISSSGKIIYRHVGVIDQKSWDEVLYPLIKKYSLQSIS